MALRHSLLTAQLCRRQSVNLRLTSLFHEQHKKSNYAERIKISSRKGQNKDHLKNAREGLGILKEETVKWGKEWKRALRGENVRYCEEFHNYNHGDYEYAYNMNEVEDVSKWIVTTDNDLGEGKSSAEFILGPRSTGIFRGHLNQNVPKDGVIKRAGYANIRSPANMKSFLREEPYDWAIYTHIVVRIRGDGRPVKLCLGMERDFDVQWNDVYQYPLFTRGGPYWQEAKIPFSKFYLTHKGRIQDKQEPIERNKILWVGFTIADKVPGPFFFEFDFIAALYDENHEEKFAYELYETRTGVVY